MLAVNEKLRRMGDRDEKVALALRQERPDLLDSARRIRAGYDLFTYVGETSVGKRMKGVLARLRRFRQELDETVGARD